MLKQPLYDKIARLNEAIGPLEQVLWDLQDHRSTRSDAGRSDGFALATDHLTKAVAALETERSETIWSLSCATTDPVARLPFEVSSKILLHLPSFYVDTAAKLLRVCRAWNRIAEATPHLWTVFRSARIASTKVENLLKLWLFRAYPLPVSLVLEHLDSYIRDILDENSHRAQNLTLLLTAEDSKRWNNEMRMISQRRSFGALRTLTIDSYEDPDTGRYSILDSPSNTLDMLRGMPNLEEFTFLCITPFKTPSPPSKCEHMIGR
ncbi:hypothetical protein FB45DRAFT_1124563 [Roridomyces roridus]|uniref:F-box domain-containing protein n=1 Tax=Roridomyces roridus TaxID=1738132 RepID=A0AAD7C7B1_9AGAR|nr:hypothetical protein FB45DRAFT_1124563 [Roridomyces roridus]